MTVTSLPVKETYLRGIFPHAKAGDLLLFEPDPTAKSGSVSIQRILRFARFVRFSHVAIALNSVHAIHSVPGRGVHISRLSELISERHFYSGRVEAFRHATLDCDVGLCKDIERELWHYFNQPYFHPLHRIGDKSSYCSELAAKAYLKIGVRLTRRSPRRTLPLDIEQAVSSPEWLKVSVQYLLPVVEPDMTSLLGPDTVDAADLRESVAKIRLAQDELHARLIKLDAEIKRKMGKRF